MARLVVGGQFLLFRRHDATLALWAKLDALDGFLELTHADVFLVTTGGQQCRLVDCVFDIRADKTRRSLGQRTHVHGVGDRLAAQVDTEDGLAATHVRPIDNYPPVKAAGPQQRRVENVRPVRRRQDNDMGVGVETVHLHQNLVQRLLTLVVGAAQTRAALAADGIDLIDEDDEGAV